MQWGVTLSSFLGKIEQVMAIGRALAAPWAGA